VRTVVYWITTVAGPRGDPNTAALSAWWRGLGVSRPDVTRAFRTFNANSGPFRKEAEANEGP
jgi:sulfhydrogenase subunit delta